MAKKQGDSDGDGVMGFIILCIIVGVLVYALVKSVGH